MKLALSVLIVVGVMGMVSSVQAQTLEALEREITGMIDRVSESIVAISATADRDGTPVGRSVGCGVVFDRGGLVLTTASVVGYARKVELTTSRGQHYAGVVVGTDPASDIAVIRAEGADLRPVSLPRGKSLQPGSWVFVLGNAFGSLPSVSMGVVSGLTSDVRDDTGREMLRVSVSINPGDTGAPVVNARGEVVGIAVGRISFSPWAYSSYLQEAQGFGFGGLQPSSMSVAVPAERAFATAREIVASGGKERGFLGVRVVELGQDLRSHLGDPLLEGVVVTEVLASSPAESVGLAPGDVITSFGTRRLKSVSSLLEAIGATKPGDVVAMEFVRSSKKMTEHVRITPFLSEYLRGQVGRASVRTDDVDARIDYIRAEIERLEANLKELERQH
jgi:serine protease Do